MVVVHGDDFTCLGPKRSIIHYEDQLASRFEIKRRGHIGESDGCIREIRILNRILRLTADGLRYEADPRHAEMLVKALGLDNTSAVLTPGIKEDNNATDYDAQRVDGIVATPDWPTSDSPIAATLVIPNSAGRNVSFDLENTVFHDVVAYSDIYGVWDGWRRVPFGANPYTGKSERVGTRRIAPLLESTKRDNIDFERRRTINAVTWRIMNPMGRIVAPHAGHASRELERTCSHG